MTFSHTIPAIYETLKEKFGVSWDDGVIITYGDTIYSKHPIPEDWAVHEEVHIEQQLRMGAREWWDKYIEDPIFRLRQELQAYWKQSSFIMRNVKDKNLRFKLMTFLWKSLSSPMYGSMVSYEEAQKLVPYKA